MTLPPDLPDDGPSIPSRFRVYPEPRPTEGDVFLRLAVVLAVAALLLIMVLGWGLSLP